MESLKQNTLLDEAICYLSYAERELNRPKEDVVTYCACHFNRQSAIDFLKAFLVEKRKIVTGSETLQELYTHCIKLEPKFKAIDLSCFACIGMHNNICDEKYCLSVDNVNTCYAKATEIKELVLHSV